MAPESLMSTSFEISALVSNSFSFRKALRLQFTLLGLQITEKIDVYAFGVIFWEIMTRKEPFPGIRSVAQLKKHVCEEEKRPNTSKLNKELGAIFHSFTHLVTLGS